jgi:hypothetical protein
LDWLSTNSDVKQGTSLAKLEESMHPIALISRYGESEDRRDPPSKRNPDVTRVTWSHKSSTTIWRRMTPEPVIGPRLARTRWANPRYGLIDARDER